MKNISPRLFASVAVFAFILLCCFTYTVSKASIDKFGPNPESGSMGISPNDATMQILAKVRESAIYVASKNNSYQDMCSDPSIKSIIAAVEHSARATVGCASGQNTYVVEVKSKNYHGFNCVDSTGFSGNVSVEPKITEKISCN
jgi:hypothetical protein